MNKQLRAERNRRWEAKNPTYYEEYYQKHRNRIRARIKARYESKKDAINLKRRTDPHVISQSKKHNLKARYGMTLAQYEDLLLKQDGKCAICGKKPKILTVDHSHTTGEIRGLLCHRCNVIVGFWESGDELFHSLRTYLERYEVTVWPFRLNS